MSNHIHLDVVGGIAGDMFVAALIDAFPDLETEVIAGLAKVIPCEVGAVELFQELHAGLRVKRFRLAERQAKPHHHHGEDNSYRHLKKLIASGAIDAAAKQKANTILTNLAHAEAKIHESSLDQVHFHELADWDSLMDVVAAGIILARLPQASWSVSNLPRGGGLVSTQHGRLPVPAPATAELLSGFAFFDDGVEGERITPTGAAILKTIFGDQPLATIPHAQLKRTGYGAGSRHLPGIPNILRCLVFERHSPAMQQDTIALLEFDIDDMSGEEIAWAADTLRILPGVMDLTIASARGKKNRNVERFRLLTQIDRLSAIADACFQYTTTLGVRWRIEQRFCLTREVVDTQGELSYKIARRPDGSRSAKVESDSLSHCTSLLQRRRNQRRLENNVEDDFESP